MPNADRMLAALLFTATVVWLVWRPKRTVPKPGWADMNLPEVKFAGDNSPARYQVESKAILAQGYAQASDYYTSKGLPFCMRDPNDAERPLVILPVRYLSEVQWVPEEQMSFWKHIDKQSILTQIGGPGLHAEVVLAARQGLNRALTWLIEPLQEACLVAYEREFPPCADWVTLQPYPLIVKIFASMSACVVVGPELCSPDHEWQRLSMSYVEAAVTAPSQIKASYPTWMYWASQYLNDGVRRMWRLRGRGRKLLEPVLKARVEAGNEFVAQGGSNRDRRKYEDGVQWLHDAYKSKGKALTTDQLTQDLFVIMTASIHNIIPELIEEIVRVRKEHTAWTRQALGELRLLDSFMRESARFHALNQYTAIQRVPTEPWTFKDGLTIPAGTTIAFPGYHHGFDPTFNAHPEDFDARRHLNKRQKLATAHKFHFASVADDMLSWGAGRHSCPGRFFAQETLKLMFIHLLTNYELKHAEETKNEPRFVSNNLFHLGNVTLPIMVREKRIP